ncbi:MAG: hypothetical protein ACTSVY_07195 [Candidatus Helarchaeota archaeon]
MIRHEVIINEEKLLEFFKKDYEILDFSYSSAGFLAFLIKAKDVKTCYLENNTVQQIPIKFEESIDEKFFPNRLTIDDENRIYLYAQEKNIESAPTCIKLKFSGNIESYFFLKNHISNLDVDLNGNIYVSYSKTDENLREKGLLFEKYDLSGKLISARFPDAKIQITTIPHFTINKQNQIHLIGLNQKFNACFFIKLSAFFDLIDVFIDLEECSLLMNSSITIDHDGNIYILPQNSSILKIFNANGITKFDIFNAISNGAQLIKKILIFNGKLYVGTSKEIIEILID